MGQLKNALHTNLRDLRLWHYKEAEKNRALAKALERLADYSGDPEDPRYAAARSYLMEATLHDSAVEVLNDVVSGPVA